MRSKLSLTLLFALVLPSLAFAQDDPGQVFVDEGSGDQDPNYIEDDNTGYEDDQYVDDGAQQGEYVEEPVYADPNDPNAQQQQQPERLGRQLSLALDVPIFLTNTSLVRPGVGAHLRFGYEFGMVVPQVKIGISTNFLSDEASRRIPITDGATNLNAIWASVGIRLQILNRTRFVPVIDAGLRLQFWNYPSSAYTSEYLFEPGVTVGAGLAIEVTARFGLEVGLDMVVAFPVSDAFADYDNDGTQFFLMPHLGGTIYF
ncbi:MAG: hypothetical protein JJ863_15150 [Deltaproteobacteria bacterium]|nr:hypothetical protein [Deltaproteobacteria bacterium]